jgi:hypothetical protein
VFGNLPFRLNHHKKVTRVLYKLIENKIVATLFCSSVVYYEVTIGKEETKRYFILDLVFLINLLYLILAPPN